MSAGQHKKDYLEWLETESRLLGKYHIFDLYESKRRSRSGHSGTFYLLRSNDWVNIVPVLPGGGGRNRFLMVRQYRHGADRLTVEFPAGLVDEGESPEAAARRELLEETGYRAGRMRLIGKISPNPAFMTNWCYTFLAEELERIGEPSLDALEHLEAVEVAEGEVAAGLGRDGYINAMTVIALQWYLNYCRG